MKNNKRKLAVICLVVMMMVTAVGYAAWSDTVVAEGTATAALFNIKFVEGEKSAACNTKICGVDSDKVEFSVDLITPSQPGKAILYLTNDGEVPAYFDDIDIRKISQFPGDRWNFTCDVDTARIIPAGETRAIVVTFELAFGYQNSDNGNLTKWSDKFEATVSYKEAPPANEP